MNQNWLVTVFFFALLLATLYDAFLILAPFLPAIIWAVILAILAYPPYAWLLRSLKGRATLAALIVVMIVALLVLLPRAELAWFLSQETIAVVQSVRSLLNGEGVAAWMPQPWLQRLLDWWSTIPFHLAPCEINWRALLLIGNRLGLPVLFLLFGLLGGVALFGDMGIISGPVLFALLRALLDWKSMAILKSLMVDGGPVHPNTHPRAGYATESQQW